MENVEGFESVIAYINQVREHLDTCRANNRALVVESSELRNEVERLKKENSALNIEKGRLTTHLGATGDHNQLLDTTLCDVRAQLGACDGESVLQAAERIRSVLSSLRGIELELTKKNGELSSEVERLKKENARLVEGWTYDPNDDQWQKAILAEMGTSSIKGKSPLRIAAKLIHDLRDVVGAKEGELLMAVTIRREYEARASKALRGEVDQQGKLIESYRTKHNDILKSLSARPYETVEGVITRVVKELSEARARLSSIQELLTEWKATESRF